MYVHVRVCMCSVFLLSLQLVRLLKSARRLCVFVCLRVCAWICLDPATATSVVAEICRASVCVCMRACVHMCSVDLLPLQRVWLLKSARRLCVFVCLRVCAWICLDPAIATSVVAEICRASVCVCMRVCVIMCSVALLQLQRLWLLKSAGPLCVRLRVCVRVYVCTNMCVHSRK